MGMTYCGAYADAIDSYSHEGYAARILPDGTETSRCCEPGEFVGYRAHCDCGWRGTNTYPPTAIGEYEADEDWNYSHLQPMIDSEARHHRVPARRLLDLVHDLRASALMPGDYSNGLLSAANNLEDLLEELADETDTRRERRRTTHVPRGLLQALRQRQMGLLQVRQVSTQGRGRPLPGPSRRTSLPIHTPPNDREQPMCATCGGDLHGMTGPYCSSQCRDEK